MVVETLSRQIASWRRPSYHRDVGRVWKLFGGTLKPKADARQYVMPALVAGTHRGVPTHAPGRGDMVGHLDKPSDDVGEVNG